MTQPNLDTLLLAANYLSTSEDQNQVLQNAIMNQVTGQQENQAHPTPQLQIQPLTNTQPEQHDRPIQEQEIPLQQPAPLDQQPTPTSLEMMVSAAAVQQAQQGQLTPQTSVQQQQPQQQLQVQDSQGVPATSSQQQTMQQQLQQQQQQMQQATDAQDPSSIYYNGDVYSANQRVMRRNLRKPKGLIPGGPCACCGTRQSPQWRRPLDNDSVLCNACGIYYTRHKVLPTRRPQQHHDDFSNPMDDYSQHQYHDDGRGLTFAAGPSYGTGAGARYVVQQQHAQHNNPRLQTSYITLGGNNGVQGGGQVQLLNVSNLQQLAALGVNVQQQQPPPPQQQQSITTHVDQATGIVYIITPGGQATPLLVNGQLLQLPVPNAAQQQAQQQQAAQQAQQLQIVQQAGSQALPQLDVPPPFDTVNAGQPGQAEQSDNPSLTYQPYPQEQQQQYQAQQQQGPGTGITGGADPVKTEPGQSDSSAVTPGSRKRGAPDGDVLNQNAESSEIQQAKIQRVEAGQIGGVVAGQQSQLQINTALPGAQGVATVANQLDLNKIIQAQVQQQLQQQQQAQTYVLQLPTGQQIALPANAAAANSQVIVSITNGQGQQSQYVTQLQPQQQQQLLGLNANGMSDQQLNAVSLQQLLLGQLGGGGNIQQQLQIPRQMSNNSQQTMISIPGINAQQVNMANQLAVLQGANKPAGPNNQTQTVIVQGANGVQTVLQIPSGSTASPHPGNTTPQVITQQGPNGPQVILLNSAGNQAATPQPQSVNLGNASFTQQLQGISHAAPAVPSQSQQVVITTPPGNAGGVQVITLPTSAQQAQQQQQQQAQQAVSQGVQILPAGADNAQSNSGTVLTINGQQIVIGGGNQVAQPVPVMQNTVQSTSPLGTPAAAAAATVSTVAQGAMQHQQQQPGQGNMVFIKDANGQTIALPGQSQIVTPGSSTSPGLAFPVASGQQQAAQQTDQQAVTHVTPHAQQLEQQLQQVSQLQAQHAQHSPVA